MDVGSHRNLSSTHSFRWNTAGTAALGLTDSEAKKKNISLHLYFSRVPLYLCADNRDPFEEICLPNFFSIRRCLEIILYTFSLPYRSLF